MEGTSLHQCPYLVCPMFEHMHVQRDKEEKEEKEEKEGKEEIEITPALKKRRAEQNKL